METDKKSNIQLFREKSFSTFYNYDIYDFCKVENTGLELLMAILFSNCN